MKKCAVSLILAVFLVSCGKDVPVEESVKSTRPATDFPTLSAEDVARAMQMSWAQYTLPVSKEDRFALGAIIEFGDGRKPLKTGSISPAPGGSKVKLLVWRDNDLLKFSILADGLATVEPSSPNITVHKHHLTSHGQFLENPFSRNSGGSGGNLELDQYLIKGSSDPMAAIDSSTELTAKEAGLRLVVKPVTGFDKAVETASN